MPLIRRSIALSAPCLLGISATLLGCNPESAQHHATVGTSAPSTSASSGAHAPSPSPSATGIGVPPSPAPDAERATRPAPSSAPVASHQEPFVLVTPDSPLEAGCKPARAGDRYWDFPDRINAKGIILKQTPTTSLRGYLFWTSLTEACLRVDARTMAAEEIASMQRGSKEPPLLQISLSFSATALEPISPPPIVVTSPLSPHETWLALPAFRFDNVEPDHVYSVSARVRCTAKTRKECRAVHVFIRHPTDLTGAGIGIELKDGKPGE